MKDEWIRQEVKRSVCKNAEYQDDLIENEPLERIGITSLNLIVLIMELEEKFQIEFEDNHVNFQTLNTVEDLVNYVCQRTTRL